MKNLLLPTLALLISLTSLRAQLSNALNVEELESHEYGGFQQSLFLLNMGIARSEAMGKTAVAEGNSVVYSLYNPALLGTLKNYEVQGGTMQPNSNYDEGYNVNASVGIRYFKRFASSLTFQKMRSEAIDFTDEVGNIILTTRAIDVRVNLSTAYLLLDRPNHKLDAGLGLNYTSSVPYTQIKYEGGTIDLGLNYRTHLDSIHFFNVGLSTNNLTNQRIWLTDEATDAVKKYTLPQALRCGLSYCFKPTWTMTKQKRRIVEATLHAEYDELINSEYFSTWKAGVELKLLEILCLRAGYFKSNGAMLTGRYAYTGDGFDIYEGPTYGGGIEIPITARNSVRDEVMLGLDFANLPFNNRDLEVDPRKGFLEYHTHYSILNARLVWKIK